jgi:signal transduction histidine kinase
MVLRPLELKPQLDKTCEALSNQIGGRLISYDIPANLPKVRADSDRCEQIFTNLLSNAIKYSPADGRIELRAGIDPDDPSKVRVYVSDSGPGIPEEQQQLLFRRFGRVDNPLVRNTHGAGLGLFISKSLAEAQGGDIWLASSDSQGTTFAFNLPIAGTPV